MRDQKKKQKLVLATGNSGKVKEIDSVLENLGFEVIPQSNLNVENVIEDGLSFVENSLIKSRHASRITGLPAVADDSGISIDALNGAPGIYSARYAGDICDDQANNDLLLKNMRNVVEVDRGSKFVCVLSYVRHAEDPMPIIAQGVWHGRLLFEERGTEGFGYDPLFWVPTHKLASAELEPNIKRKISHRAKALKLLCQQLTSKI